eukprot:7487219-Alexandrium_andersonii.AAC.1
MGRQLNTTPLQRDRLTPHGHCHAAGRELSRQAGRGERGTRERPRAALAVATRGYASPRCYTATAALLPTLAASATRVSRAQALGWPSWRGTSRHA